MSQNELPPVNETERDLANKLFCVTTTAERKTKLTFSPSLQRDYNGGLHSPLQQLSSFSVWNSLMPPPEDKISNSWSGKMEIPELSRNRVIVFSQLHGSPAEIFLSVSRVARDLQKEIDDEIIGAEQIMLFGAISIPNVVETLTWLKTKGFKGKLSVFDISPIPIGIGRIYKQFGLISDAEFIQSDVLSLPKNTPKADLIISDVLGYCLTPEQYVNLTRVVENTLSNGGLWLTRELIEPKGAPKPEDRSVSKSDGDERINRINRLVKRLFNVELPIEDIQQFENTRWNLAQTYPRHSGKDYQDALPSGLENVSTIRISSQTLMQSDNPRIFETSIIKKDRNNY
ncbi:hypothetical protein COW96_04995 [Candidatus Roizmanbacteria bacterium CG22_combo_CG10-13_8_21_14_all_33_16]|uniref:Methyltransferase type 11 domain-containing protein n=1 Tax=Candidatus Roizmanbacteria bacterium CG22_combo_CG10-13_8_21_14_all_33_16 TaxID=1974859 RepID=A0A2H0C268_9BACT|nr:MAG: hypothetical protein COW96_04995 [Candidatus Roizmanbacteria bacterium CG22_combo_CG10-13_8_21_14_all_33_16]